MSKRIALQEAFKFALSMALFFWLALAMDWDMPGNGGLAILIVSLGTAGASYSKALYRVIGTTFGVAIGYFAVGWLGQSEWGTLTFFILYIVIVGYMMQVSNASYAWYVAGFVPFMVWSSSYMTDNVGLQAFEYGTFRYLETTTGILVYTLVSILIWPKRAGDQLPAQAKQLIADIRDLFGTYRKRLRDAQDTTEPDALSAKLSGELAGIGATLDAAYHDSSPARENKAVLEAVRANLHRLLNTLELWGESARDCSDLKLRERFPDAELALDGLDRRLARIAELWSNAAESPDHDSELLEPLKLTDGSERANDLSHSDIACLTGFRMHWELLDQLTCELLRCSRILAGFEEKKKALPKLPVADISRKPLWDGRRLINALFPAACFIVAWFFWIYTDPPGGASVPATTIAIALNFVLARMNAMALLNVLLIVLVVIIAPVYMWVMPALDTGMGLLVLIFCYSFLFAYLGAFKPPLKLVPILLFVNVTGISNEQTYSFMALVGGGQMFLFCFSIIALVDMLWASSRPEQQFLRSLKRFFRGCADIAGSFSNPEKRGSALRRQRFESVVAGAPTHLRAAAKQLDPKQFPGCDAEGIKRLTDGMESIILRLQSVGIAQGQLKMEDRKRMGGAGDWGKQLGEILEKDFLALSRLDGLDDAKRTGSLKRVSKNLEQHLDNNQEAATATAFHALLGSIRGLVAAIDQTGNSMRHFDWSELTKSRF